MKNTLTFLMLLISVSMGITLLYAQWIQQNSGTNEMLTDVIMLDTETSIAVGRDSSILRTSNAGTTWINVAAPLSFVVPWNGVSFFDTANVIVVGDHGVVLTTSNRGESWISHYVPGEQKCLSALQIGPDHIYVGADSGWVYYTSEAGRTWTNEKISTWPIRSLFMYRGPTAMGAPINALTPYLLCTQDVFPPSSWNESILTNFEGLGSEAYDAEFCNGGGAGFIVGVQGDWRAAPTILRKSMSDTEWRNIPTGIIRDGTLFGVSAPSENVIFVCGSNGMIFKSFDGGNLWLDQSVQTSRNINAIFFYDETHGFAVGDSGLILHTSNGGLTDIADREGSLPAKFLLEQNYPNPFNPSTNIPFTISSKSFVTLKVFDIVGREIVTIVSEELSAGIYSKQWNASGMPSGVYFYRISVVPSVRQNGSAGSYSENRKLVLLR